MATSKFSGNGSWRVDLCAQLNRNCFQEFTQPTYFCYKNVLQIFSVGFGNVKNVFLTLEERVLKGEIFLKRSFN